MAVRTASRRVPVLTQLIALYRLAEGSILPRHTSPDCVISLGVLRPSATSFEREAALVLVDVGLSPLLWQRCGVEGVDARTFCGEFVQNVVRLQA